MSVPRPRKLPSRSAILRAVASSTAIETGEGVAAIEARLQAQPKRTHRLALALNRPARPARP